MQVARAATNQTPLLKSASNPLRSTASYAPLYLTSSLADIAFDIEELEASALARLKLLKAAETARSGWSQTPFTPAKLNALRTSIRSAERSHGLHIPPYGNPGREDAILKDEASHFLLRLALCKTHEHRAWLLQTEYDLFTTRLEGAGADFVLKAIEKANGPIVEPVTVAELEKFSSELDAVARGPNRQRSLASTRYYKIAFEEVPGLVRHRKVFLSKGTAYLQERNILDVISAQFRSKLSGALATAAKAVAMADRDKRMHPILESIRLHYAAAEELNKSFDPALGIEKISFNQINESVPAMPLCMVTMMTKLREQHHLRYAARLQLGVFLKGCGLTVDESLRFWKAEFGRGQINADKFEKQYAYNIRHQYGKEGKRKNLTPFPCIRIINDRPGPGEHNGCPYREFEENRLQVALRGVGTDPNAIPSIVAKSREGNFQTACGMCFAVTQPGHHPVGEYGQPQFIPTHPNEYFIEARRRRFAPDPEAAMIDEEIDDEEMLLAAEAIEGQSSAPSTPVGEKTADPVPTNIQEDGAQEMNEAVVNRKERKEDNTPTTNSALSKKKLMDKQMDPVTEDSMEVDENCTNTNLDIAAGQQQQP